MLRTATRHRAELERLALEGERLARRAWNRDDRRLLVRDVSDLQVLAVHDAERAVADAVSEQGMRAPAAGELQPAAFVGASDGRTLTGLFEQARTQATLQLMAATQVADVARVATGVGIAARPAVTGYVREVGGACCSRCAILAGRFYRWSTGFQRHPGCRCMNVPTSTPGLATSPAQLWREGRITDLTTAERKAIEAGGDIGRVVNVRRSATGLHTAGGRMPTRRVGQTLVPTPEAIYRVASSRDEAIRLLLRFGYIT